MDFSSCNVLFGEMNDEYKFVILKGGIDEGEDPRNAAIRELREETGVSSAEVIAEVQHFNFNSETPLKKCGLV